SMAPLHRPVLSLIAGCLTFASAGCFHFLAKPIAPNPSTQQQMEAYAEQQTELRRDASHPREELRERCDQLATAAPGVEEIRTNGGTVESRQWTLVATGSAPRWTFVKAAGSSGDGWAPKPGIDKLDFQPPLEPALASRSSFFLSYAPAENQTLDESRKSAAEQEVFGAAQGNFTWHGRKYSYTLTPDLPCFAVEL
ncbi:MAG: hypothetical protein ACREQH_05700, partial [Candidatus Binatus sp.]